MDDPVGAISVHLFNGIWGTLCVGLFAEPGVAQSIAGVDLPSPGLPDGGRYDSAPQPVEGDSRNRRLQRDPFTRLLDLIYVVLGLRVSEDAWRHIRVMWSSARALPRPQRA